MSRAVTFENIVHKTCHLTDLSEVNVYAFNQAYAA